MRLAKQGDMNGGKCLDLGREYKKLISRRRLAQDKLDGPSRDHEGLAIHSDLKHETIEWMFE